MTLSKAQNEALAAHIQKHLARGCNACTGRAFSIIGTVHTLLPVGGFDRVDYGEPLFPIECTTCGHTMFFKVKAVLPDLFKSQEAPKKKRASKKAKESP